MNRVELLSKVKDSKIFWLIINQVKPKNNMINNLELNKWHEFLFNSFSPQVSSRSELPSLYQADPLLDSNISIKEIIDSLIKCKGDKAPGPDGIRGIFYKSLPPDWIAFLGILFNRIMDLERVPDEWSHLQMFMLHKKGDLSDPYNYNYIYNYNKLYLLIYYNYLLIIIIIYNYNYYKKSLITLNHLNMRKGRSRL